MTRDSIRLRTHRMHQHAAPLHLSPEYKAALVVSAALNVLMFFGEGAVGLIIGSAALIADAADFLEDAAMYALAVAAIGWSLRGRAWAGLIIAGAMAAVGAVALWQVVVYLIEGGAPSPAPMAGTAAVALAVNVYCAWRLVKFKRGDASMRGIWLSTRNDAMLNMLTIVAAGAVALFSHGWPDIAAGVVIAAVNLWAAGEIFFHGTRELKAARVT